MPYPNVTLRNGQLSAVVFLPGTDAAYYRASRFDHGTMIGDVRLGGHVAFGSGHWREPHDPEWTESGVGGRAVSRTLRLPRVPRVASPAVHDPRRQGWRQSLGAARTATCAGRAGATRPTRLPRTGSSAIPTPRRASPSSRLASGRWSRTRAWRVAPQVVTTLTSSTRPTRSTSGRHGVTSCWTRAASPSSTRLSCKQQLPAEWATTCSAR